MLNRAGLLANLPGLSGGYRLAKTPAGIHVGEILRAAEGGACPQWPVWSSRPTPAPGAMSATLSHLGGGWSR